MLTKSSYKKPKSAKFDLTWCPSMYENKSNTIVPVFSAPSTTSDVRSAQTTGRPANFDLDAKRAVFFKLEICNSSSGDCGLGYGLAATENSAEVGCRGGGGGGERQSMKCLAEIGHHPRILLLTADS